MIANNLREVLELGLEKGLGSGVRYPSNRCPRYVVIPGQAGGGEQPNHAPPAQALSVGRIGVRRQGRTADNCVFENPELTATECGPSALCLRVFYEDSDSEVGEEGSGGRAADRRREHDAHRRVRNG